MCQYQLIRALKGAAECVRPARLLLVAVILILPGIALADSPETVEIDVAGGVEASELAPVEPKVDSANDGHVADPADRSAVEEMPECGMGVALLADYMAVGVVMVMLGLGGLMLYRHRNDGDEECKETCVVEEEV